MHITLGLSSSPNKIWGKSVQFFQSYYRTNKQTNKQNKQTDYNFIYIYVYPCLILNNIDFVLEEGKENILNRLLPWCKLYSSSLLDHEHNTEGFTGLGLYLAFIDQLKNPNGKSISFVLKKSNVEKMSTFLAYVSRPGDSWVP